MVQSAGRSTAIDLVLHLFTHKFCIGILTSVVCVFLSEQLWVAQNLGMLGNYSWTHLGQNVTRYSWRVLDTDIEANTAVYFEQATNSKLAMIT